MGQLLTAPECSKKLKEFPKNSRMTSYLLSNNDVIDPHFAKKTQDKLEKTQLPAFGDVGLCPTIAEIIIFFQKGWRFEVYFCVCKHYCVQNKERKCMDQNLCE